MPHRERPGGRDPELLVANIMCGYCSMPAGNMHREGTLSFYTPAAYHTRWS